MQSDKCELLGFAAGGKVLSSADALTSWYFFQEVFSPLFCLAVLLGIFSDSCSISPWGSTVGYIP